MAEQDPGETPQDQRPPAYNGPFLFVNKNATNLRSREREEVFAVRSHAMQIARRSRKPSAQSEPPSREGQASADSRSPNTSAAQGFTGSPTAGPIPAIQNVLEQQAVGIEQYQQRQSQGDRPTQSRRQSTTRQLSQRSSRPATSPDISLSPGIIPLGLLPVEHAASLSQLTSNASPSNLPGLSSESTTGQPSSDKFFNSVLQFWRLEHMSNFWPAHIYLTPSHQAVQMTDGWLQNIVMHDPAMLHGVFAGALSYITNYLPPLGNTSMLWARAVRHYGKCLEETRSQLAQPGVGTEQSLSLVHGMSSFSFHCQDLESCQVHRTASIRLLQNLEGGLEAIHPVLKYLLVLGESLIAGHVPRRPLMDIDSWAPKPWAGEPSLRRLDENFTFDAQASYQQDTTVFLLDDDDEEDEEEEEIDNYSERLLELINWHREALTANELAFSLRRVPSPGVPGMMTGSASDESGAIYTWLSTRHYALNCLCSDMFVDFLEMADPDLPLRLQLYRSYHCCVLLATSYVFQFVMRRDMDAPCMAYIPYHHLRTQLELLMSLMSRYSRFPVASHATSAIDEPPINPVPSDGLLFLFFAGALGEEFDGPSRMRTAHRFARAGMSPAAAATEHPGSLLNDRWFSVHFAMVLQRLNIEVWENASRVLKRFVYAERVLDQYLRTLVANRLEFLAILVGSVPSSPAIGGTGYPVTAGPYQETTPAMRPTWSSHQPMSYAQGYPGTALRQPGSPANMQMPMIAGPSTSSTGQALDVPPLFGHIPGSASSTMPSNTSGWWQGMGYGWNRGEDFAMNLDMNLNLGPPAGSSSDLHMQGREHEQQDERYEEDPGP